ncbi:MAG: tetratricopeptide repeat protein, partial [Planctomycetota bacterium]
MADLQALRAEAESLYEQGDREAALDAYLRLLELDPGDSEVLNDIGTVCFAMGRRAESCGYYLRALKRDAGFEEARSNLRLVCQAQGLSAAAVLRGAGDRPRVETPATGPLVCPCCGGSYHRFLPAGGARKIPNRKCPGCGSLERHRAIWLYMV